MRYLLLLMLSSCMGVPVFAQVAMHASIKGVVADAVTKAPVEYATVIITDKQTNKLVNGNTTDSKGHFKIDDVPQGNYKVVIEFVGYRKDTIDNVAVTAKTPKVDLNTILLYSSQRSLKDVTITASAPIVENKIDRIVYNAANDVTSQGGVALDVLKKVPQVNVDVDGNVDIQGDNNIRFLINGKPSSIFTSPTDALNSIPASQIKSIEVITSPGAKYDAEGTGGIINIILKESRLQGVNGNINLSAGTRLENGAVSLNYRHNNFGINAFFSGNAQLSSHTPSTLDRRSYDSATSHVTNLHQSGYTDYTRKAYHTGIGFDWKIDNKNSITGSLFYFNMGSRSDIFIGQQQAVTNAKGDTTFSDINNFRNGYNQFQYSTLDMSLDYKRSFAKDGQELDILYSSSFGLPVNNYDQEQTYREGTPAYEGAGSHNPGTNKETDISVDYTHPVDANIKIEVGAKTILQEINSTANVDTLNVTNGSYYIDPTQFNTLHYTRQVYAGYVSGTFLLLKYLNVKTGIRIEHTDTKIDLQNTNIPSYNSVVPSIILSHDLKKGRTIKLSYTHRIERPDYRELNPFLNRSDPYNITTGNPFLKPELGDNIELGYNKTWNSGYIYVGLYERIDGQDLKPVTTVYATYQVGNVVDSNVSVSNIQNTGIDYNTGLTVSGAYKIKDKLSLRGSGNLIERVIVSRLAHDGQVSGMRYRLNMNASYELPGNLVVEAFANYNSATVNIQGTNPQSLTYTFAFRKQFWNKNASIGATATNIFSPYIRQVTTTGSDNYSAYAVRELPYRSVGISFTYKFGKLKFKAKEQDEFINTPPPGE